MPIQEFEAPNGDRVRIAVSDTARSSDRRNQGQRTTTIARYRAGYWRAHHRPPSAGELLTVLRDERKARYATRKRPE